MRPIPFEIRDGLLVPVPPKPAPGATEGVRRSGNTIQLGLTREEIDELDKRLRELLQAIDDGQHALQ